MASRGLFIRINSLKNSNPSRERLDVITNLINGYERVIINLDDENVHKMFEILRQITSRNVTAALSLYFGKVTCPEGYDSAVVEL